MASVLVVCSSGHLLIYRTSELGLGSGFTQSGLSAFRRRPCEFNIEKGRNHWPGTVTLFRVLPFGELTSAALAAGCNQILRYRFLLAGNIRSVLWASPIRPIRAPNRRTTRAERHRSHRRASEPRSAGPGS